jgi:hypothetical protein
MSDLKQYVGERKKRDREFAKGFEEEYEQFKAGVLRRLGANRCDRGSRPTGWQQ